MAKSTNTKTRSNRSNSKIRTRFTGENSYVTETIYRPVGSMTAAIETTGKRTTFYINHPDYGRVALDGREARTLFRTLYNHYTADL